MKLSALVISIVLSVLLACVAVAADSLDFIKSPFRSTINAWLAEHPQYRLALAEDCQCDDDIETLRNGAGLAWRPQPDYQPYYLHADFDGNRQDDVAVVVLAPKLDAPILVLVLLSVSEGTKPKVLEIPRGGSSVTGRGLFLGLPQRGSSATGRTLLFGAFASEAEEVPLTSAR